MFYSIPGAEGALPDLTDIFPRSGLMHDMNQRTQYTGYTGNPLDSMVPLQQRGDQVDGKRFEAKGMPMELIHNKEWPRKCWSVTEQDIVLPASKGQKIDSIFFG